MEYKVLIFFMEIYLTLYFFSETIIVVSLESASVKQFDGIRLERKAW